MQEEGRMKQMWVVVWLCAITPDVQSSSPSLFQPRALHRRNVPETSYVVPPRPLLTTTTRRPGKPPKIPVVRDREAAIIKQTDNINPNGDFSYSFVADNGISVEAKGSQKSLGPGEEGQVIEGRYSYKAPDGTPVDLRWYADETGFHVIP